MSDTIRTKDQLLEALKASPASQVFWHMGSKPSAPGSYNLSAGLNTPEVRVYAKAVHDCIKLGKLRQVRADWMCAVYRYRRAA
jgi:hypothetical protein